jgi:hypothetical protein
VLEVLGDPRPARGVLFVGAPVHLTPRFPSLYWFGRRITGR